MRKSFLKRLTLHDKEYEVFKEGIQKKIENEKKSFIKEIKKNKNKQTTNISEEVADSKLSPHKIWAEAIKKGKF